MKKLKSAFNTMLLGSNVPGTIRIKRFSNSKFSLKRFSAEGDEVLDEEVVVDDEAPVSEEIAESVPSEDVAVFSDPDAATDEIVVAVDGGSTEDVIKEKTADDFVADEPTAVAEIETAPEPIIEEPVAKTEDDAQ